MSDFTECIASVLRKQKGLANVSVSAIVDYNNNIAVALKMHLQVNHIVPARDVRENTPSSVVDVVGQTSDALLRKLVGFFEASAAEIRASAGWPRDKAEKQP